MLISTDFKRERRSS